MAEKELRVRYQFAYKTETEWTAADPVIRQGEIAISSDRDMFKIGNGISTWTQLQYSKAVASDVYDWAKASTKPSYSWSEITGKPSSFTPSSHTHAASDINSGTLDSARLPVVPVSKGGTGLSTITSGQVLVGNGTGNVTTRAIDTTNGGTSGSTSLITSGAVYAGLAGKSNTGHTHSYLPLTGGILSGDLSFSHSDGCITWDSGTYRQRIKSTDDSASDTNVFTFQQSSDSGSTWTDLMTIKANSKVIASEFVGSLSGNAATSTSATKATQDSAGQQIDTTYIKSLSVSGQTITYTKGNNDPGTITTQDKYVLQGESTTENYRPLVMGYSNNSTSISLGDSVTNQVYVNTLIYAQPSTGTIFATKFTGDLEGNAATAAKWATARTITLTGSVTGSVSIDGSGDVTLNTTTNHNHDADYVNVSGDTMTGELGINTLQINQAGYIHGNDHYAFAAEGQTPGGTSDYNLKIENSKIKLSLQKVYNDTDKTTYNYSTSISPTSISSPTLIEEGQVLTNRYLRLTGGTMTGNIYMSSYGTRVYYKTTFGVVGIQSSSSGAGVHLFYQKTGSTGWDGSILLADENGVQIAAKSHDHTNMMHLVSANGYYGMALGDNSASNWIRTTGAGIIPYQSGGSTDGHCGLGTSSWYFASGYIQNIYGTNIYEGGTALSSKYAALSHTHSYLPLSGGTLTGEIKSTAGNVLRMVGGNYGSFFRNDGTNTYLLLTNSGDQYGSFNSLRPFCVSNSTGKVSIGNGLGVSGGINVTSGNIVMSGGGILPYDGNLYIKAAGYDGYLSNYLSARLSTSGGEVNGRISSLHGTYTGTASERFRNSALEIRENNLVANAQSDIGYAPAIGFHWGGRIAASLLMHSDGSFRLLNQAYNDFCDLYIRNLYLGGMPYGQLSIDSSYNVYLKSKGNGFVYLGDSRFVVPPSGTAAHRAVKDNAYTCGHASYRYTYVYAVSGTIQTSDEREKDILSGLSPADMSDYFMSLKPIAYRWNSGSDRRIHFGLGAQTAKASLEQSGYNPNDFSLIQHDVLDEVSATGLTDRYGMDYQGYNILTMAQTQKNTRELDDLRSENSMLKEELKELKALISGLL